MSNVSIAMVCNVYQDAKALRGLLETSAPFFDNLFIVHSGPNGAYSTDGTIEICEQFGATVVFDDISKGFGAIRSRLVHDCGCTWAMILDADERFYPTIPILHCEGNELLTNPAADQPRPNLSVHQRRPGGQPGEILNQGQILRDLIKNPEWMAIRTTRRHWYDFSMRHPSQNWLKINDHQLRIVRNTPDIIYKTNVLMHEQIIDNKTNKIPNFPKQDDYFGPFHDHFHLFFRHTQPGYKEFNEQNYQRLERGEKMLTKD